MHPHIRFLSFIAVALLTAGLAGSAEAQIRARQRTDSTQVAVPQATRAVDMFIKIEGVDGEATDSSHEKWIDVLSVDWGTANSSRRQRGPGGSGAGTLTVTRSVDRATPKLSEACTSGRSLGQVVVHVRASGGGYDEYVIDDARVRSCSPGSSGDRPTENITLNFGKVESRPAGNPDRPVVTGR